MKAYKKITYMILITIMLTLSIKANASEYTVNTIKLDSCTQSELVEFGYNIAEHYINGTNIDSKYIELLSADVNREIDSIKNTNNMKISNIVVDRIYPDKSTTGDTVLMVNIKAWDQEQTYNNLYLMELHVNRDGKIYGYNIWAY